MVISHVLFEFKIGFKNHEVLTLYYVILRTDGVMSLENDYLKP